MEVRPHEQIVVKVDGSRRLTLRNRRFVGELDPRKTSLEDRRPTTITTPPQMPGPGRIRRYAVTPPAWSPPSPTTPTPPQPVTPEPIDEFAEGTEELRIEDMFPAQTDNGDDHHDGGGGPPACVEHNEEAPPVEDPEQTCK